MEEKEVKLKLINLFGSQLRFNKEFDRYAANLKDGMKQDLINWCINCKENKELGSVPPKKEFKNLYVFFRKIAGDIRVTLVKEQNSNFIEITLDNHKTYDDTRTKYGYKKSSYYGS